MSTLKNNLLKWKIDELKQSVSNYTFPSYILAFTEKKKTSNFRLNQKEINYSWDCNKSFITAG